MGLHPAIRCNQEGTLRVRRSHYQQSNGVDGGDPGAPRVQGAHAAHEDNNRCDWLAQNAGQTQTSSWPDGTPHGRLRLDLGRDYVPPKPQAGLFDTLDPGENDEDESDPD